MALSAVLPQQQRPGVERLQGAEQDLRAVQRLVKGGRRVPAERGGTPGVRAERCGSNVHGLHAKQGVSRLVLRAIQQGHAEGGHVHHGP